MTPTPHDDTHSGLTRDELERFSYIARHELRAPLRALLTLPEWIRETLQERDGGVSEDIDIDLREIELQSRRMDQLVTDLLAYVQAGQNRKRRRPLDTGARIRDHVASIDLPDGFRVDVATGLPKASMAPADFDTILSALIGNALKHHDLSEGAVRISARTRGKNTDFDFIDDGPGIPPEFAHQLFEMSTTLRPKDDVEGSGMGLAIARRIARLYGGDVTHVPGPGTRGSTFRLRLPAHDTSTERILHDA